MRGQFGIELGGQAYATSARLNGKDAVGIGVQLTPSGTTAARSVCSMTA